MLVAQLLARGLALTVLGFLVVGCLGSAARDPEPTPNSSEVFSLLQRAAENLADADSVVAAVRIRLGDTSEPGLEVYAQTDYVAPGSLTGIVWGSGETGDFIVEDGIIFREIGGDWFNLQDLLGFENIREYSGGLLDLAQLRQSIVDERILRASDKEIEFTAGMGSVGLNSYLVRIVEWVGALNLTAYLVRDVDIRIDRKTQRFEQITFTGTNSTEFEIDIRFSGYNSVASDVTPPVGAPTYALGQVEALTPTPIIAIGCARDIDIRYVLEQVGHTFLPGEEVAVTIEYSAPGCKNVIAEFSGEYQDSSPRYQKVCRKQCDGAIEGTLRSEPVPLPVPAGSLHIVANSAYPAVEVERPADRVAGFKLCMISLTFSDGALGGTFYKSVIGSECQE
ncbi:MAG: hypothetical protein HY873_06145 [Chloroflexi bacterium]|nr:hypothetical protein [Chloroflexota bacterium]